ncbi:hypothetical protein [Shewanella sp. YIC-542]|uniref:hypothetical protein n=1 Tax=Shewanella mytili TaxID=3377111 RepID=UPI00398E9AB6
MKNSKWRALLLGTGLWAMASGVQAIPTPTSNMQVVQQFSTCLTDSMTGKERKLLARWVFMGMAQHPEIQPYANVTAQDREHVSREVGALLTRLLTQDCEAQTKTAIAQQNSQAVFEQAFSLVGQLAMQELMLDQAVSGYLSGIGAYMDAPKMQALQQ